MPQRDASIPRIQERYALQRLYGGGWKTTNELYPTGVKTIATMIANGWLELDGSDPPRYRITATGIAAFRQEM